MRDKKKKGIIYIVILLGVLFLFVGNADKTPQKEEQAAVISTVPDTEERLKKILQEIEGVGNVDVMIVYRDNGRKIYARDVRSDADSQESQAVMASESGKSAPFVVQEKKPAVQGVIIVADGGNQTGVQEKLKKAAAAVLDVYPHNIAVYGREQKKE